MYIYSLRQKCPRLDTGYWYFYLKCGEVKQDKRKINSRRKRKDVSDADREASMSPDYVGTRKRVSRATYYFAVDPESRLKNNDALPAGNFSTDGRIATSRDRCSFVIISRTDTPLIDNNVSEAAE